MKNVFFYIVSILAVLSIISCTKKADEDYLPQSASSVQATLKIAITDISGKDLLANKDFTNKTTVYGKSSKVDKIYRIEERESNHFLLLSVDLPDKRRMSSLVPNENGFLVSYGTSEMLVKLNSQTLPMLCTFGFGMLPIEQGKNMLGGSTIYLTKVECDGAIFSKGTPEESFILSLVYDNEKLFVKK